MNSIYLSYNNIVSSLGFNSETVVDNVERGVSGVKKVNNDKLFNKYFSASLINSDELKDRFHKTGTKTNYTRLETMMILSLQKVIEDADIELNERVGLIISTTKGNIDLLENASSFPKDRVYLSALGKVIKDFFDFENEAIILSNACVSGILAVSVAKRYITEGVYDHVFIVSGDIISRFVLSGFDSFQALSDAPCMPYDKNRSGINLGEAAASILVTSKSTNLSKESVLLLGEATCNDANHISGPSRTGEGLYQSIKKAMEEANLSAADINYISGHGTATSFNDEMEAIAFNRVGLAKVPLNSFKGYFGHTLGASGLFETIIGMHSLHRNKLFASKGFNTLGVSKALNVIEATTPKKIEIFLKTASGFGGCNTAAIFKKVFQS